MFIEQPPLFLRWIWRPAFWRGSHRKKIVYLTFDDGPVPTVTDEVLKILDKYNVKATFFCVGDNVRKNPELFEQVKAAGHAVGNHTMNHLRGYGCCNPNYYKNVTEADNYIDSKLFRPPYGRVTPQQLKTLSKKYKVVMWDVITRDYNEALTPDDVFSIAKKYTRNGSVIVFHDQLRSKKNVLGALPKTIEYLLEKGFSFEIIK